ncbi:MAG TPA: ATP-binding cassette domain-containing protein [Streptosporangiaceae bacterium]|nr:ATP-binding cassette domain-containing protein [Streptosporangiaceae bacterium]
MATESLTQPVRRPSAQPLIDLRLAGVTYPRHQTPALRPIDLAVRHGELVTLTGPAGSGKSTLLSVVGLLLRPTTGSYLLNGADTARLADRERTALRGRLIGFVFQRPQLLPARSALDNVMIPALYAGLTRQQRVTAATGALERVGLGPRLHAAVAELPASERQRVAIARAIVTDPSLLLCDDPTASLDQAAAAQIIGLLVSLHKDGRTVVVTTRDQLAAAHSSRHLGVAAGNPAGALDAGA